MDLKDDSELAMSPVVANCRMNRERELCGGNSYTRDLGLDPVEFLTPLLEKQQTVRWLDLCCGSGRALIAASNTFREFGNRVEIVGVDLAGMFASVDASNPKLIKSRVEDWRPTQQFDLITCVHGLHYVGDKLAAICRAASWLTDDGLFMAHLDLNNLKHRQFQAFGRKVVRALRDSSLSYDSRRRLIRCLGRTSFSLPWSYVGGDDEAGPNFTGQPAINSWYEDSQA
jgi:SAM-dependent methyltransferase